MIVRRFHDDKLAAAGYLVGCAVTGEAMVVDALRDPEDVSNLAGGLSAWRASGRPVVRSAAAAA